jgi:iron(III) transport system substrate-binding protein
MVQVTRRAAAAGLAALALAPKLARADLAELEAAARKEGTLTWYIAQVDTETAEAMGRAFTARHPGIKVSVMRTTGQVAYQRLLGDLKNNSVHCDVFGTTDISHMPALIERGALARYVPANAAGIAPAFKGLGEDGLYYPTTSTVYGIGYNTLKVKPEEAPQNWTELLDPRWKNQVSTGHPGFSGYMGVTTVALTKLYDWSFFEKLAKHGTQVGRSGLDPITLMNAGERTVAMVPLSGVLRAVDKGSPIAAVYPRDGAVLCIGPSAILAKAPHPNAARLFMEWLLSPDYARLVVEARSDPVRAEVPPKAGAKPLSEVKLLRLTTAEIGNSLPDLVERWRDTFGS